MRRLLLLTAAPLLLASVAGCHLTQGMCDCDTRPTLTTGTPSGAHATVIRTEPVAPGLGAPKVIEKVPLDK